MAAAGAAPAQAHDYGTAYLTNWGGCDALCAGQNSLSYTDDQIQMFESEMNDAGHSRTHGYVNGTTWASDLVEDAVFGGDDRWFSDDGQVYAFSGHGGCSGSGWSQTFSIPMCRAGSVASCNYNAEHSRLGESLGTYATPSPGEMRWLILATCHSVDSAPYGQWSQVLTQGLDLVMGYRGVSADSECTDEVLEDLVGESFDSSVDFKPGWFWAIEDWWIDDTAGIVASGASSLDATTRRDHLDQNSLPRNPYVNHNWIAWAYHEG